MFLKSPCILARRSCNSLRLRAAFSSCLLLSPVEPRFERVYK